MSKRKIYFRTEQVKQCEYAVSPPFAEVLVNANLPELYTSEHMKTMRIESEDDGQLKFA